MGVYRKIISQVFDTLTGSWLKKNFQGIARISEPIWKIGIESCQSLHIRFWSSTTIIRPYQTPEIQDSRSEIPQPEETKLATASKPFLVLRRRVRTLVSKTENFLGSPFFFIFSEFIRLKSDGLLSMHGNTIYERYLSPRVLA